MLVVSAPKKAAPNGAAIRAWSERLKQMHGGCKSQRAGGCCHRAMDQHPAGFEAGAKGKTQGGCEGHSDHAGLPWVLVLRLLAIVRVYLIN